MLQDVAGRLGETFGTPRSQHRVQDDVVSLEGCIGLKFAAPVAILMLLREQQAACGIGGGGYTAGEVINLAETELWCRRRGWWGGVIFHRVCSTPSVRADRSGSAGNGLL